jgi:hypothetical protein
MRHNFLSWILDKETIYFLTDKEIFSQKGKNLFKDKINSINSVGCKNIEFPLGHEAIRIYFNISPGDGVNFTVTDFWNVEKLPLQIAEKIAAFDKNFGRTFKEHFWFYNLEDVLYFPKTPNEWMEKFWQHFLTKADNSSLAFVIAAKYNGQEMIEPWRKKALRELIKRGGMKEERIKSYLQTNASEYIDKK